VGHSQGAGGAELLDELEDSLADEVELEEMEENERLEELDWL
jgi:hypothetical protein